MTLNELANFVLPDWNDPIQVGFGAVILSLTLFTIGMAAYKARPAAWELRWRTLQGAAPADGSTELGSVNDISDAASTPWEKLADVMPGILLILGLLGTFLSLGIALNKASSILAGAGNSPDMSAAMANMMGMMEGLGTKFKTSAWGISAFLLLKVATGALGNDERRLGWSAGKLREAFERARQDAVEQQAQTKRHWVQMLSQLEQRLRTQGQQFQGYAAQQAVAADRSVQAIVALGELTRVSAQALQQCIDSTQSAAADRTVLAVSAAGDATRQALLIFQQSIERAQTAVADSTVRSIMAAGDANRESLAAIRQSVDNGYAQSHLDGAATLVLLQGIVENAERDLARQAAHHAAILAESSGTRAAVEGFVDATVTNLAGTTQAAENMAAAAADVGHSAEQLQHVITALEYSVSGMLSAIQTDLGTTISTMSTTFSGSMETIAAKMSEATDGISQSIGKMSETVDSTMSQVNTSINETMGTQRRAQAEFTATAVTLSENVEVSKNLVENLGDSIKVSLTAVSTSNRKIADLVNRFDAITATATRSEASLAVLVDTLARATDYNPIEQRLIELAERIDLARTSVGETFSKALEPLDQRLAQLLDSIEAGNEAEASIRRDLSSLVDSADSRSAMLGTLKNSVDGFRDVMVDAMAARNDLDRLHFMAPPGADGRSVMLSLTDHATTAART
jgi:hypothetical protein